MLMKNFGFCSLTSPMMSKYSCARCIIWQVSDENMADRKLYPPSMLRSRMLRVKGHVLLVM